METLKKAHKQWSLCAFGEDCDLTSRVSWTNFEPVYKRFIGNSRDYIYIKHSKLTGVGVHWRTITLIRNISN
jgi:hypothetical protein